MKGWKKCEEGKEREEAGKEGRMKGRHDNRRKG